MNVELKKTEYGLFILKAKLPYLPNGEYGMVAGSKAALVAAIQHDIAIWTKQAEIHHSWRDLQLRGIEDLKHIVTMIEKWELMPTTEGKEKMK